MWVSRDDCVVRERKGKDQVRFQLKFVIATHLVSSASKGTADKQPKRADGLKQ
jgi:hypothetical protein